MHGASGGVPAKLSMVVLSTNDVPGLAAFYRSLGWPEQAGGTDVLARFNLGDTVLALYNNEEADDRVSPPTAGRPATTLVIKLNSAEAVDAAHASALAAGAQPISELKDQPWGARSAVVADPEGNRWELLWVSPPQS